MLVWLLSDVRNAIIVGLAVAILGLGITVTFQHLEVALLESQKAALVADNIRLAKDLSSCKANVANIKSYAEEARQIRAETAKINQRITALDNTKGVAEDEEFFKIATDIFARPYDGGVQSKSNDKL